MASVDRRFGQTLSPSPAARFGVRPSGNATIVAATPDEKLPRDRVRDLFALGLLAACLFVVAALATFHPADPPASRVFPPHARAENACGLIGATASATLYEAFGLGAWFVVAFLAVLDIMLLRRRPLPDLPLRAIGSVAAIAGGCTLLAMFLPDAVARPIWGPGGYAGATGKMFAERYFATAGAAIVVTAITGAGLFLAADAAVVRLTAWLGTVLMALVAGAWSAGSRIGSLARWPRGLRRRTTGMAVGALRSVDEFAGDRDSEFDPDDDSEPMIRVKRREIPALADDERADESDADTSHDEVSDEVNDEDADESVVDEPPVPIKSLTKRRSKPQVLDLAPDPVADYELPSLDLLLPTEYLEMEQQEQEVRERARVLEKTFAEFGFKVKVVEIETGPVISQYEIELEAGLRLAKITNLGDDLAIALRVPSVRIVAPIPGKNSVGIEVPNTTRQMVRLREVIEETQAKSRSMKIPIYLGKDVAGNPMVVDMAGLPHLLIAGRTGTGKSVCLNSIIVSMLMTRRPDEVRMLMIDPKMVELTPYKSLPHLMHPVVTDMKKAEAILAWAVEKMEERYALLAKVGVRHLTQYNALGRDKLLERIKPETEEEAAAIPTTMPFIVMIADEIADMMMTAGKEIEQHIIRLAQKSRAVGIHLILATQKPTVDVITGLIKSNLPARIAFQVASRTDSRVVLDEMGAERLLGNGDMLFLSPGTSQILRGQGTFVSDDEINGVMGTIGTTEPQYAAELVNLQPAPTGDAAKSAGDGKDRDDLYAAAVEVIIREGRGSVSLLQRALGVGYGRGARLIDYMAEDGIVGQYAGSQAREVLITMEEWAARNGSQPVPADPAPRKLKIQPHAEKPVATAMVDDDEEIDRDEDAFDDESYDEEVDDEESYDDEESE
jgi:S-DNA-T family DNA segregation ATPase FtsK/SpoIIIE